jgi:hypothetical protein
VACVVGIGAKEHGNMQIGASQKVVSLFDLLDQQPDLAVHMSSIYKSEAKNLSKTRTDFHDWCQARVMFPIESMLSW